MRPAPVAVTVNTVMAANALLVRIRGISPRKVDVVLAAVLVAGAVAAVGGSKHAAAVALIAAAVATGTVGLRRRAPLPSVAVTVGAILVLALSDPSADETVPGIAALLVFYTLGRTGVARGQTAPKGALPQERCVVVDSGAFMGYPAMYLRVPDASGFVFPQAFQCVGLGLGAAIGAAVARPERVTVCAVGDGGLLMALPDLETLGRLGLRMVVVVYNDAAYGAEVHHFRPMGIPVELAQFPPTDFAALAEAAGCRGATIRSVEDLSVVREWVEGSDRPLVLDAKVDPDICAEWLEEAFRGH